MIDPAELDALLGKARANDRYAVVVPDRHGSGTNALLLQPPDVIPPAYGVDSVYRHQSIAADAGVHVEVAEIESLALDVDTPDDLEALRAVIASRRGGAAHTRGMLNQLMRTNADRG
jgi:2-phospho-L-lactate guanylyltransferase